MFPYQNPYETNILQQSQKPQLPQTFNPNFQSGLMGLGQQPMPSQVNKGTNGTPQGNFLGGNIGQYRQG